MSTKRLLQAFGAFLVVLVFFIGTLYVIDTVAPDFNGAYKRNRLRASHAEQIKSALEKYRKAKGSIPIFPDNPVDDLKSFLVDGGFLAAIPRDPEWTSTNGQQYRYVSDGKIYGLLFYLESSGSFTRCLIGPTGYKFWGEPPVCPYG
jgi:hypothetical protein